MHIFALSLFSLLNLVEENVFYLTVTVLVVSVKLLSVYCWSFRVWKKKSTIASIESTQRNLLMWSATSDPKWIYLYMFGSGLVY
jgi:hypothetical protein